MPETVLGVDPGVSETGWAVLQGEEGRSPRLADCGLIKTRPGPPLGERLSAIHEQLSRVLGKHAPDSVAVEEMFFAKAAHTIRNTLQARGIVLLAAAQARRPLSEYNPRTVKLTLTGSGGAGKAQMQAVLQKALGLPQRLSPDDVADAAAIALCHLRSRRYRRLVVLDRLGGRRA
ncbi:MAG: crossover junction endodeoxyribonuclease RuvC [Elusimicrobia bacterium]|nr:crossover junction endodeoxyribonuclease RuvC [Elusimicrobiota bacterium]MDE2236625.1 crossover junction endodeoxyribonuclease RuvC [Elusimicrobiota bacterium]MDE2424863.1 crossover junction endodeoxyribonuclease RuvC [Elusimicrobiota bacterium]